MPEVHRTLRPEILAATVIDELTQLRAFLRGARTRLRDPHDRSAFEIAALAIDDALAELGEVGLSRARLSEVAKPVRVFDYGRLERALRARALAGVGHLVEVNLAGALQLLDCIAVDHPLEPVRAVVARQRQRLEPCVEMMRRVAERVA